MKLKDKLNSYKLAFLFGLVSISIIFSSCNTWATGKNGDFSKEDDIALIKLIGKYGLNRWGTISKRMPSKRTIRECKHRYYKYLDPNINNYKEPWTRDEDELLKEKVIETNNNYMKIRLYFPNRDYGSIERRIAFLRTRIINRNERGIAFDGDRRFLYITRKRAKNKKMRKMYKSFKKKAADRFYPASSDSNSEDFSILMKNESDEFDESDDFEESSMSDESSEFSEFQTDDEIADDEHSSYHDDDYDYL